MHQDDIGNLRQLTREDVSHLRKAGSISFYHSDGKGEIVARRNETNPGSDDPKNWNYEVPVYSRVSAGYKEPTGLKEVASCHVLITMANNVHEVWSTIARFLKLGDRIWLDWRRDSMTNGYMEKHNLHGDRLKLYVHRRKGDRFEQFMFVVEVQCCENNTARMIRRGPYNME